MEKNKLNLSSLTVEYEVYCWADRLRNTISSLKENHHRSLYVQVRNYVQKDGYPRKQPPPGRAGTAGAAPGSLTLCSALMLSHGERAFLKRVKETTGCLLTHQFLLDLLCSSTELHIILMSQEASKNERDRGCLQCLTQK